jgi:hypothetical protein
MEEKRKRGRPRLSDSNKQEVVGSNSVASELEIDKTDFSFYEPETFDSPSVEQFNPLADAPIKRDYSSPKIQEGLVGDIIEPTFHQPSITSSPPPPPPSGGNGSPSPNPNGNGGSAFSNPNPAMNQLDNADKKLACEQMVDASLDLYETLWGLGGRFAQVGEQKLQELVNDGSLDPSRRIPVEDTSVSIFEFFQNYNQQVAEVSKVDKDFKKKVRPAMVRVFSKHGWGMTDEQFLGIAFAKDSIMRGISLFQMKKSINALINQLAEENKPISSEEAPPPPSKPKQNPPRPTPPPPTPPPPPPTPILTPEVEEIFDDEDFMDDDVEMEMPQPVIQRNDSVEKLKINFEDNPLRQKTRREPPPANVEETFIKGGEIKDDLSI